MNKNTNIEISKYKTGTNSGLFSIIFTFEDGYANEMQFLALLIAKVIIVQLYNATCASK